MIVGNVWAIVVAGVVSFVLGWLWYGPLFGKYWLGLSGVTPEQIAEAQAKGQKGMAKKYILTILGAVIMAGALSRGITYAFGFLQTSGLWAGAQIAFCSWLGFIAPATLSLVLWGKRDWRLWALDNGYYLVSLIIMSFIIVGWM